MTPNSKDIANTAKNIAIESIGRYLFKRKQIETSHPLLSIVFPLESQTRSIIGGIETSLGIRLWERLARELAVLGGYDLLDEKAELRRPDPVPPEIVRKIAEWESKRKDSTPPVLLSTFVAELKALELENPVSSKWENLHKGTGIDLFASKSGTDFAFDIKTVHWNAGNGSKFNSTLMEWKAYRFLQGSRNEFKAYFVIPYDPVPSGWWSKFGDRAKPLDKQDILIGEDFWSLLTGMTGTYNSIMDGFSELSSSPILKVMQTNMSESPGVLLDIELIEAMRNVSIVGTKVDNGARKKYHWKCNVCSSTFKENLGSIFKKVTPCETCNLGKLAPNIVGEAIL